MSAFTESGPRRQPMPTAARGHELVVDPAERFAERFGAGAAEPRGGVVEQHAFDELGLFEPPIAHRTQRFSSHVPIAALQQPTKQPNHFRWRTRRTARRHIGMKEGE
jgi:hypothetical protein